MKFIKIIVITVLISTFFYCTSEKKQPRVKTIEFKTFKVSRPHISHFSEIGTIAKVVKLETMDDSLLGSISSVCIDKTNGDLLVGDYDSSKKVLRFDKKGKFITSYGRIGEGPGEYTQLRGFSQTDNGDLILATAFKLIKYSKEGDLLQEVRLNVLSNGIESIKDKTFLSVTWNRKNSTVKNAIVAFDSFLLRAGGIGDFDSRYKKYIFTSSDLLTKWDNYLYYIDNYGFSLNRYNIENNKMEHLSIPNKNNALDRIWNKERITEEDRKEIRNKIRQFSAIHAYKDGLFLVEWWKGKKTFNVWLLSFDKREAKIFSWFSFLEFPEFNDTDDLFFNSVVGSYDDGIIATLDNPEEFEKYHGRYPLLKDLTLKTEDNPILVYLKIHSKK